MQKPMGLYGQSQCVSRDDLDECMTLILSTEFRTSGVTVTSIRKTVVETSRRYGLKDSSEPIDLSGKLKDRLVM